VAGAQVSAAQLAAARLSAQAQLATDYFQLRFADSLRHLLEQTAKAYQRSLQITENQYAAGTAARSDVINAQAQLLAAQAAAINVGVQRAQNEHAIALLVGKPPVEVSIPPASLAGRVPIVPTGVITAQAALLTDQENALQVQEGRLLASVALVEALGGGWDTSQLPSQHELQKLHLIPD